MNGLESHSLRITYLLCTTVVLFAVWPVLQHPRLEADDYRYLQIIQQWQQGTLTAMEAMTVENRWDHLWFMQEEGHIRFFRPTVVLSYALDAAIWHRNLPLGLTLTNVFLHLSCSFLVGYLLWRLMGPGLPSILATGLFAGLAAHSECIWYIAGRTDSLAALGFLAAFALHLRGTRWGALPFFIVGFMTKELVIVAPVLFFIYDRWIANRSLSWPLYGAYGVAIVFVLGMKQIALGGEGSDFVYPYLINPLSHGFIGHLWLQVRSYSGNLLAAEITAPFADSEMVALLNRPWVFVAGLGIFSGVTFLLRRDRRFWFFLLFALLTWLPTSFVYLSERYLYLPSVAFVGVIALILAMQRAKFRKGMYVVITAYLVFQTVSLQRRHVALVQQPGSVQEMVRQLKPVIAQIEPGDHLLLVNLPGQFVRAQFAQEILRVIVDDPKLNVDVLTMMPGQNGTDWKPGDPLPMMGARVQATWESDSRLILKGGRLSPQTPPLVIQEDGLKQFNWTPLKSGVQAAGKTFTATILAAEQQGATAIAYDFNQPEPNAKLVIWHADCRNLNEHPWMRRGKACVTLIPVKLKNKVGNKGVGHEKSADFNGAIDAVSNGLQPEGKSIR